MVTREYRLRFYFQEAEIRSQTALEFRTTSSFQSAPSENPCSSRASNRTPTLRRRAPSLRRICRSAWWRLHVVNSPRFRRRFLCAGRLCARQFRDGRIQRRHLVRLQVAAHRGLCSFWGLRVRRLQIPRVLASGHLKTQCDVVSCCRLLRRWMKNGVAVSILRFLAYCMSNTALDCEPSNRL